MKLIIHEAGIHLTSKSDKEMPNKYVMIKIHKQDDPSTRDIVAGLRRPTALGVPSPRKYSQMARDLPESDGDFAGH